MMKKLRKKYWVGCGTVNVVRISGVSSCKIEGSVWLGVVIVLIDWS